MTERWSNKGRANKFAGVDDVMAILKETVDAGARCPTRPQLKEMCRARGFDGVSNVALPPQLARQSLIKLEVYAKNWRVVEIDGKRSEEYPGDSKPYVVITNGALSRSVNVLAQDSLDAERHYHPSRHRRDKSQAKKRACLNCQRTFDSTGNGHRVCDLCKGTDAWRGATIE